LECRPAMRRRSAGEDDRLAGGNDAAAMDHPDVADGEPLGGFDRNLLERLAREGRMMLQYELVDRRSRLRLRPRDADEAHDRSICARLCKQLAELALGVELILLEARDDAHPPDTGGRNSTLSEAARTW